KLVSWVALVLSVAACGTLARRVYGQDAAIIAAALCASAPAMRGYVGTLQYEIVTGALMIAVLLLAVRTLEAPTTPAYWRRAIATGIAGGALLLTRETFAV